MSERPKISIILPSYNYAGRLPGALSSIEDQTERSWELIAVEDGSTDASLQILERFADARGSQVRILTHPGRVNCGLSGSISLALKHCQGDFVAFLDADDVLYNESLAKRLDILERQSDLAAAYHAVRFEGSQQLVRARRHELSKIRFPEAGTHEAFPFLLKSNIVLTLSCVMARSSALKGLDLDPPADPWLDWWLMAQLSLRGPFFYLPEELALWRIHAQSYNVRYCSQNDPLKTLPDFMRALLAKVEPLLEEGRSAVPGPRREKLKLAVSELQKECYGWEGRSKRFMKGMIPYSFRRAVKEILFSAIPARSS